MPRRFLDTQFVVACISERDQFHAVAMDWARRIRGQQLVTTDAVLLEIGNTLAKSYREAAVNALDSLRSSIEVEVCPIDADLLTRGLHLYRSSRDKEWGLVDCISFLVMKDRQLTDVLTFDQHFTQAGFNALLRSPP